jgi:hypothetical protein
MEIAMNALFRGLCCAAVLLCLAGAAAADQTGEIRGAIADDTGGVLPGVLVTAMSPNLQGLRTAVSDAKGFFRLPLLPVGTYDVTFELQGFEKLTLSGNEVRLGYTASLAVSLKLAALDEAITVTAATQFIDKTRSDTSYRLRGAELSRIPTQARTIAEVVALTPGVTGVRTDTVTGTDTGLPSFRGEGDNGNNWLVDGLSTKGVSRGNSGVRVNYDAWDEVQIISDGFEPENGQAMGGTVNIVTKSGGNAFHGEAGALIQDHRLRSQREPQLSAASLPETSINQYYGNLGGPIMNDKLWFFLSDNSFSTVDTTTQQTIDWLTIPAGKRSVTTNNVFGKLTYTPRTNHTLSVSGTLDKSLGQSGGIGVPETYTTMTYQDTSYRINYMGVLSENTLLTAAAGQNRRSLNFEIQSGDTGSPSYYWQDIAQTTNNAWYYGSPFERRTDLAVGASRMLELRGWGSHEIKAGVSYYNNGSAEKQNFTGRNADPFPGDGFDGGVGITWTAPGIPQSLTEIQNGQIKNSTKGFGFHVQDTVTAGWATLMLGLRTDTQQVFNDVGEKLWSWGAGDFLQPRASLAVDLSGDGRTVLRVAYGQFKMPMATESLIFFQRVVVPTLRVYTWVGPANPTDAQLKDPANWQFQWEQSSTATPEHVDPALKPNKLERVLVALERQLSAGWALKLRGVYSHASDLMEDVALYAPETPSGLKEVFTNFNLKRRDYRALEVELNGRVADTFTLDASYVWSRARGTVPGNSIEQESWGSPLWWANDAGAFGEHAKLPDGDPNKALYDSLFGGLGGVGNGDEGWYGYLPYSVDHDVKILATYLAPHGVQISTSLEWLSGYHWEKKGWIEGVGCYCAFPEGRGGRTTPALTYVDVAAQKDFRLGRGLALGLGVNVYNLFNSQRPVAYIKEDTAQFGQVWARQLPRWVQLKAALKF